MLCARYGQPGRMLSLVQIEARYAERDSFLAYFRPNARCGGPDTTRVWSAHATRNPNDTCRIAQPAVAADRFAREIVGF